MDTRIWHAFLDRSICSPGWERFAAAVVTALTPPSPTKMVSPDWLSPVGAVVFGKRTCKPNSVQDSHPGAVIPLGEALPLALISDLPGGFAIAWSRLSAPGRHRARALLLARASLPIWSCSVWGLPCRRHYCRRGALLPHLFTLTIAWSSPLDSFRGMAVCFLWHWPSTGLYARVPDVIRHTALRSSDFPLPATFACAGAPGSDRPVLLPASIVP